jgi:hypothetical protein
MIQRNTLGQFQKINILKSTLQLELAGGCDQFFWIFYFFWQP